MVVELEQALVLGELVMQVVVVEVEEEEKVKEMLEVVGAQVMVAVLERELVWEPVEEEEVEVVVVVEEEVEVGPMEGEVMEVVMGLVEV